MIKFKATAYNCATSENTQPPVTTTTAQGSITHNLHNNVKHKHKQIDQSELVEQRVGIQMKHCDCWILMLQVLMEKVYTQKAFRLNVETDRIESRD